MSSISQSRCKACVLESFGQPDKEEHVEGCPYAGMLSDAERDALLEDVRVLQRAFPAAAWCEAQKTAIGRIEAFIRATAKGRK